MSNPPENSCESWFTRDQWFQIFLAILAVVGTVSGAYLGGWMANNAYQEQRIFDKHNAANQLFIEINSMMQPLQHYANEYFNYYDLSQGGENVVVEPNSDTIFSIFDENNTRLYRIDLKYGNFTAKKVEGKPVRSNGTLRMEYPPITEKDMGIKIGNGYYIPNMNLVFSSVVIDNPIIPDPLYNDHGMYYVYGTDVSKFDKNLSRDLFLFYSNISRAESDRQYIQNYLDSHPNDKLNSQYFDAYMDMRTCIIYAAIMAPRILKELDKEQNL